MIRSPSLVTLASAAAFAAVATATPLARAQSSTLSDGVTVGGFTLRPLVEVRLRGEYRRHPFDTGGNVYDRQAVFYESPANTLPGITRIDPVMRDDYWLAERARLGLAIDRGPLAAVVTLQDARLFGSAQSDALFLASPGEPAPPSFGPSEAYVEVHSQTRSRLFARLGRQKVAWGDGRILGANDWSLVGRSLDALRVGGRFGDFDIEAIAALLSPPGRPTANGKTSPKASGAQLYAIDMTYHVAPLLSLEALGLARIVREPSPSTLTPSDTFLLDARLSGDQRGVRYALEGAYEGGRVASYGSNRDITAYALAGSVGWETALPWHLTFGAEGAYASGDKGDHEGTMRRFDPILPDEHTLMSPMGLFGWSNILTGGGSIGVRPMDDFSILGSYRYAALAEPGGRWSNAALAPIGAAVDNTQRGLGHELDGRMRFTALAPLEIEAGYGVFFCEQAAKAILASAGRPVTNQHWAYLSTTFRIP